MEKEKRWGASVFILQIIAMVTMLSDHIASAFCDDMLILRCIGRFAFPIYAFLIAEGFRHIKDDPKRVEKHLGGYIFLAVISEFCYDLAECKTISVANFASSQSAMITLLLGFLGLMAIERWKDTNKLYMWSAIVLTAMLNYLTMSNYKFAGVLLIYLFYFYLNHFEEKNYFVKFGALLLVFAIYLPIYHWARYNFCDWTMFVEKLKNGNKWWYLAHIPVAALLASYNGEKGYSSKHYKLVYRYFYPVHLLVIGILFHTI